MYSVSHTLEDLEREKRMAVRAARREGIAEGEAKGRQEGENILLKLNEALLAAGRIDDLKRATSDKEYRQALLAELGI